MTTLQEWGAPVAVLCLLAATLLMATLAKRHQAFQTAQGARVRALIAGAGKVERALDALRRVPLSRELRVALRSDLLARYRYIARRQRRDPGVRQKLKDAEAAVEREGPPPAGGVGPLVDHQAYQNTMAALDALLGVLRAGETFQAMPDDVRAIFCRELGERRAEVAARYYFSQSKRYEKAGDLARARGQLKSLKQVLIGHGQSTPFIRELHAEAGSALRTLAGDHDGQEHRAMAH